MSVVPYKVVTCERHDVLPYHFVCDHLLDGESRAWVEIPTGDDGREVSCDYGCHECAIAAANGDFCRVSIVCMSCVSEMLS